MKILNAIFCSKNVLISFVMSFIVITWSDGLVVKALECHQKSCGLKFHFEHSSLKEKSQSWGFNYQIMVSTNNLPIMLTWKSKSRVESQDEDGNILDSSIIQNNLKVNNVIINTHK